MLNFIIDIFCKETIIGLSEVYTEKKDIPSTIKKIPPKIKSLKASKQIKKVITPSNTTSRIYKNVYSELFNSVNISEGTKFKNSFIDPTAYHLLIIFQNQKALYSV